MKKILLTILFIFLLPNIAFAFETKSGNLVSISADEVIEGSLFIQAEKIEINGVINGDVFCLSPDVKISGTINGDVLCVGESFDFSGTSTGNLRLLFADTKISGKVEKNTNILSDNFDLSDGADLSGELFILANQAKIAGEINGDLFGTVQTINISSFVGGDISLRQRDGFFSSTKNNEFKLSSGATVLGDFNFKGKNNPIKEEGVIIKGEENKTISKEKEKSYSSSLIWPLISIFSNILISFVFISLFRNYLFSLLGVIKTQSSKSILFGSLALLLLPLSIFLIFLTMIGMPLALMLLFVFGIIIIVNKSIISIAIGAKALELIKIKKTSLNKQAVVGAIILYALTQLPFVGSFISFASVLIVLGAIIQNFRIKLSK